MNPMIMRAYERYDSDPRVGGPDDYDAFEDAIKGLFTDLMLESNEDAVFAILLPTADSPTPTITRFEDWLRSYRDWNVQPIVLPGE